MVLENRNPKSRGQEGWFRLEAPEENLPAVLGDPWLLNTPIPSLPWSLGSISPGCLSVCFPLFYFVATPHGAWDLSSPTGVKPVLPATEAWNPKPWTTREFPYFPLIRTRVIGFGPSLM